MTNSLLLHKKTKKQTAQLIKRPPQALLIYGPPGSGKQSLAEYIASRLLAVPIQRLKYYPYFLFLTTPDAKQGISIDQVRELIRQLSLRAAVNRGQLISRVVVIDGAQCLSVEAQNALLKIIEEPPAGTIFVLTAISETSVLPTIASRAEKLAILPVDIGEAKTFYEQKHDAKTLYSAWSLSGGAAGLLHALLQQDDEHPLKQAVECAKKLLTSNNYQRLLLIDSISADKYQLRQTLEALGRVLVALHHSAINSGSTSRAKRLIKARILVNSAAESLEKNSSPRLVVLNLALRLPV